jgi:2-keto-4-pentenoate hydratase/2-oxohepta-3-ene-1,7-dioic acid hydratase in catechol pathway
VGDGSGLEITLDVNGERRQTGNTSQMLRPVPELIAAVSRWFTLEPGDLVFTGTPHGVGPVVPGDRLEARIERVGSLRVSVAAEAR